VTAAEVERALEKARRSGINVPEPAPVSAAPAGGSASLGDVYKTHGRLTFSLTDTITLADSAVIAPGTPRLDFLHGGAIGQTGGQPRHQVEAQAGWSNNGLGARVGFDWRSATDVDTLDAGPLHFSPFATFNLRLFANVGQDVALVAKHPGSPAARSGSRPATS
jgi:hypothetical protein